MPITTADVLTLANEFHETVMIQKGDAGAQGDFFLYPEPRIILLHGEDLSLQQNHEIHQNLTDEKHVNQDDMCLTVFSGDVEKARAVFTVYWQGKDINNPDPNALLKCYVGEDWIIQRNADGELKFVSYIIAFHHFLPDSAPISFD